MIRSNINIKRCQESERTSSTRSADLNWNNFHPAIREGRLSICRQKDLTFEILNAKTVEQEVQLISLAGQKGRITIATNMAGRGTDIMLGEGVAELGGLYVIGTERNESRRIDNQLKGRSGRQGDPGCTEFFISLEDDLIRRFAQEDIEKIKKKYKVDE